MAYSEETIKKMLPETYLRKHVAGEVFITLSHFKNLVPMMDEYVFNDGTTKYLMSLSGTICTTYEAKTYNIPVCVWLPEDFPQTAPICYVRPTRDMLIIRSKHVSSNGEVLLPYLQEWNHSTCDLVSLLQVMSAMFGEFPPLCLLPERELASCWLQFHRQAEVRSTAEGIPVLCLSTEDGRPLHQENETNC